MTEPFTCRVHLFDSPSKSTCAYESGPANSANAILFVGGLTDGPHTVPFVQPLAKHLEASDLDYSVFEIRMRSSFDGFGFSSLRNDVEDIAATVKHLRSIGKRKIVLMGHSTGSQDCAEYAAQKDYPVDGFILQGPVSDREGVADFVDASTLKQSLDLAERMIQEGRGGEFLRADQVAHIYDPITAYRWHSLVSKG